MAPIWKTYTKEIYRSLRYLATWPPSNTIEVGDIVVMEGRSLEHQLKLVDLGVPVKLRRGADVRTRGWTRGASVSIEPGLAGKAPVHPGVGVGARMKLSFDAKHSFILRAERSHEKSLERLDLIKKEMLRLRTEEHWEDNWLLVTHVVHAANLVVLLSDQKNTSAELSVSAGIEASPGALARAEGQVSVIKASEEVLDESGTARTPLYLARRVKRTLRGRTTKRVNMRGRARPRTGEFDVVDVTF